MGAPGVGAAAAAGAAAGAPGGGRPAGADELIWYRCAICKSRFEGSYKRKTILHHEDRHRIEAELAREAQEQREADRARQQEAKAGKAKRKFKARDKRLGGK